MAKIYLFGSCSGTEHEIGRHHTSFALEVGEDLYWFDAGENCSYTATEMGLDLLKVKAVFISHPHIDHVGGLPVFLAMQRKLVAVRKVERVPLDVFLPCRGTWDGIMEMLKYTEHQFYCPFPLTARTVADGVIFDDGQVRVTAFHNHHMPQNEDGSYYSYTYRVETEGKSFVFSGDVKGVEDLGGAVGDECDLLLMETGHHKVEDVCRYVESAPIGRLIFVHHGRAILDNYEQCRTVADACRKSAIISEDKDIYTL